MRAMAIIAVCFIGQLVGCRSYKDRLTIRLDPSVALCNVDELDDTKTEEGIVLMGPQGSNVGPIPMLWPELLECCQPSRTTIARFNGAQTTARTILIVGPEEDGCHVKYLDSGMRRFRPCVLGYDEPWDVFKGFTDPQDGYEPPPNAKDLREECP